MIALLVAAIMFCVYAPGLWVRWVLRRYGNDIEQMPGTGGELAEHLIERFELERCQVETTDPHKDHYDAGSNAVRLSQSNYDGKSLTAVAIAAHEVGHALQHHRNEKIFQLRTRYLPIARRFQQVGALILWLIPIALVVLKSPVAILAVVGISILFQIIGALSYLLVLPEEWDASFNKALPILIEGKYIHPEQIQPVQRILRAAALTYFASALANALNIGRLVMLLLRR